MGASAAELEWLPGETKEERQARLHKLAWQRWNERHPGGQAAASRKHRKTHPATPWPAKREMGLWVVEYKETHPCMDCNHFFPACAMDFDHRPGEEKLYNVGTLVAHGYSKELIMAEIAKCDLVCACCHRVRTRDRRTNGNRV
jgi:hypothetical protein